MKNSKKYDVLIIGDLCGFDLNLAEHLTRKGLKCCVARHPSGLEIPGKICPPGGYHQKFKEEQIIYFNSPWEFLNLARSSHLLFSFTGALIGALKRLWFFRRFLGLPPVVNHSTGSDIMELATEKSLHGLLYRQYLRFVDINIGINYPDAIYNIIKLKLKNVIFINYFVHNLVFPENIKNDEPKNGEKAYCFFHGSHLDWKITDPGQHRRSAKGNDRFIRAFAKAIQAGMDAYCIILERGPDKGIAKNLIQELGVAERFIWKPHLSRDELMQAFCQADVVVDQFDVGGIGALALEAMAAGKPVMMYLQENCQKILYSEPPPILNCCTEEEIYQQIMACRDRALLLDLGRRAQEWVKRYHNWDNDGMNQFLFYFNLLTGRQVIDYGCKPAGGHR